MTIKSFFKYLNIRRNKKVTAEEKLQAIQLTCNVAQEMRIILTNAYLINEMFIKAEQHIFEDKKILELNTFEYETLYKMLDLISTKGIQTIETIDRIIFLLRDC